MSMKIVRKGDTSKGYGYLELGSEYEGISLLKMSHKIFGKMVKKEFNFSLGLESYFLKKN